MILIPHIVYLLILDINIDILFVFVFQLAHVKILKHGLIAK